MSRITRGKVNLQMGRVDLVAALQAAIEASQPAIDARQHRLAVSLPQHGPLVHGDATRLTQVFANLLNNAAKFTPAAGAIDVRMRVQDGEVAVAVRDSGVGIDAAMLDRVFELFAQAEDALQSTQPGLGIGLTLARELVALHGGTLVAASDGIGRGATFTVTLPLPATR